jgi:hypothetical protein
MSVPSNELVPFDSIGDSSVTVVAHLPLGYLPVETFAEILQVATDILQVRESV